MAGVSEHLGKALPWASKEWPAAGYQLHGRPAARAQGGGGWVRVAATVAPQGGREPPLLLRAARAPVSALSPAPFCPQLLRPQPGMGVLGERWPQTWRCYFRADDGFLL